MEADLAVLRAVADDLARRDASLAPVPQVLRDRFLDSIKTDVVSWLASKAALYHTDVAHSVVPAHFGQIIEAARRLERFVASRPIQPGVPYFCDLSDLEAQWIRLVTPAVIVELIDKAASYVTWGTS